MDRLNQLRGEAGGSGDSTLDTSSPPSEAYISANDSASNYFSLSEVDSTFDISPIKDVALNPSASDRDIEKKIETLDYSYKIDKQIDPANILSGGVNIFDDNESSYDGDGLVIDDNVDQDGKSSPEKQEPDVQFKTDDILSESSVVGSSVDVVSKDTEVVLHIDGRNVDAIDIGNGLYLYRKEGEEELAAVQIIDDGQEQPTFKFLKVRENVEGNLEVYEEIEIEVSKEVPQKEGIDKTSHVPIKDINKVISEPVSNKVTEGTTKSTADVIATTSSLELEVLENSPETKSEGSLNVKMMKFSELRKSPVIGSFTPMTYHSTPNKEGKPLTKTMVNLQLDPSRHSDNVKKTIEVHTDNSKNKLIESSLTQHEIESPNKNIDNVEVSKIMRDKKEVNIEYTVLENTSKLNKVANDVPITEDIEDKTKQDKKTLNDEIMSNVNLDTLGNKQDLQVNPNLSEIKQLDVQEYFSEKLSATEKNKQSDLSEALDSTENRVQTLHHDDTNIVKDVPHLTKKQNVISVSDTNNEDNEHKEVDEFIVSSSNVIIPKVDKLTDKNIDCDLVVTKAPPSMSEQIVDVTYSKIKNDFEDKIISCKINEIPLKPKRDILETKPAEIVESKLQQEKVIHQLDETQNSIKTSKPSKIPDKFKNTLLKLGETLPELGKIAAILKDNEKPNLDQNPLKQGYTSPKPDLLPSKAVEMPVKEEEAISKPVVKLPKVVESKLKPIVEDLKTDIILKLRETESYGTEDLPLKLVKETLKPKENTMQPGDITLNPMKPTVKPIKPPLKPEEVAQKSVVEITQIPVETNVKTDGITMRSSDLRPLNPSATSLKQAYVTMQPIESVQNTEEKTKLKDNLNQEKTLVSPKEPLLKQKQIYLEPENESPKSTESLKKPENLNYEHSKQEEAIPNPIAPILQNTISKPNFSQFLLMKEIVFKSKKMLLKNEGDTQKPGDNPSKLETHIVKSTNVSPHTTEVTTKHITTASTSVGKLGEMSLNYKEANSKLAVSPLKLENLKDSNEANINRIETEPNISLKPLEKTLFAEAKCQEIKQTISKGNLVIDSAKSELLEKSLEPNELKHKPNLKSNIDNRVKLTTGNKTVENNSATCTAGTPVNQKHLLSQEINYSQTEKRTSSDLKPKSNYQSREVKNTGIHYISGNNPEQLQPMKIDAIVELKPDTLKTSQTTTQYDIAKNKVITAKLKDEVAIIKDLSHIQSKSESKPIHIQQPAVPFGKWTEINRQEFLNKFKETKAPSNSSNGKQMKNSNDLNRRDILKKIDSQRQQSHTISKIQDSHKSNIKSEKVFVSKVVSPLKDIKIPAKEEPKILTKTNQLEAKKPAINKKVDKSEISSNLKPLTTTTTATTSTTVTVKKDSSRKNDEINAQDLIEKAIVDMLNRPSSMNSMFDRLNTAKKEANKTKTVNIPKIKTSTNEVNLSQSVPVDNQSKALDAIEMKMNELHGIPFIERPSHELPHVVKTDKTSEKETKIKLSNPQYAAVTAKETVIELDSEDEIIEHIPVTGDIKINKTDKVLGAKRNLVSSVTAVNVSNKDAVITEKEFDKFARRNSMTMSENSLTVNFSAKEPQTFTQAPVKTYSKNEIIRLDPQTRLPISRNVRVSNVLNKGQAPAEDPANKNYQSKLQIAYQSALTKRQKDRPITIIEDKPVKVVFMDTNTDVISSNLNVQGQALSPAKKIVTESETATVGSCDSLDSELISTEENTKLHDEVKAKTKHLRKQVHTPVETPELELIQPGDLDIEVSPKKKRRTEDNKTEKHFKNLVHKKSYLLGRSAVNDKSTNQQEAPKSLLKDAVNKSEVVVKDTVSAIDNLVKAAELIENQSESNTSLPSPNYSSQQSTPVKRGRGRPRKYPIPEGAVETKTPVTQKKPRLIDAKKPKPVIETDDEEESSEGEIVQENWTMGKINENIVCPICNKLFRSENVVFKHVKHCTGPSPNRSDEGKRSPRRQRFSQESDSKSRESKSSYSDDTETDEDSKSAEPKKHTPRKRKTKDSIAKTDTVDKGEVIVIEDTPVKPKVDKKDEQKPLEHKKVTKSQVQHKPSNLACEFCGKTFRQLTYLVNHKLQHKKEDPPKDNKDAPVAIKSVFSCEVCKKDFRKLHHLVQHRIIHNPSSMSSRLLRKSSTDQSDQNVKDKSIVATQSEDQSAGFRCEPCDKSFRKLHHLVEHRETHDGINRQKVTATPVSVEKPTPPPQCDVCKKTFRKLHHLIEHKEQHLETSSEKSDDKSVVSCLSTKDIIHECSLCYMVFPNEYALNKHSFNCQKKKRQSKLSQAEEEVAEDNVHHDSPPKVNKVEDAEDLKITEEINIEEKSKSESLPNQQSDDIPVINTEKNIPTDSVNEEQSTSCESPSAHIKIDSSAIESVSKVEETSSELPDIKKVVEKDDIKINENLKKNTPMKGKSTPTSTKRQKTALSTEDAAEASAKAAESSDDDDVRYMLNPDFKVDETTKGKVFMKVRANKRNSLQIERPNSKDLVKRRISLQHPPKISRLKPKPVEPKLAPPLAKVPKLDVVPSTDSDDSDVTYSFPEKETQKAPQPKQETPNSVKGKRKSVVDKRKSLASIAKRKLSITTPFRHKQKPSPPKPVKKRIVEVGHRCDCGQLFSSAALLTRHTSLAHTPPRVRRRRSPAPPSPRPPARAAQPSVAPTSRPPARTAQLPAAPSPRPPARAAPPADAPAPKQPRRAPHRDVLEKSKKRALKNAK